MSSFSKIGLIGSGGQADEAESFAQEGTVVFRAVDEDYVDDTARVDVKSPDESELNTPVVGAVGAPAVRKEMMEKWPGANYTNIVSEHALVDKQILPGGCIIAPYAVITTNVKLGKHTIINVAATIGHNTKLGEFVTISPGANIAGNVELGDGVFVGIGAVISNDVSIAPGVVIGAGAVVIKDIDEQNSVHAGVPARKINQNGGWLREV